MVAATTSEQRIDSGSISARSPFRSSWFIWRTLEFGLALAVDVFVLIRYWSQLSEHLVNVLVLVIGIFMLVFPYRMLIRTCSEMHELCQRTDAWESDHKTLLTEVVATAQGALSTTMSNYFTTVLILIAIITYCFIRK